MGQRRTIGVEWRDSRWRIAPWAVAASVLALPAIGMLFTDEIAWDLQDFLVMGAMLIVACATFELAARATTNVASRTVVGIGIAAAFMLVWLQLAVGLF